MIVVLVDRGAIKVCSGDKFIITHGTSSGVLQMTIVSRALLERSEQQAYFNIYETYYKLGFSNCSWTSVNKRKKITVLGFFRISGGASDDNEIAKFQELSNLDTIDYG